MKTTIPLLALPFSLLALGIANAAEEEDAALDPMVIKGDVLGKASDPEVLTYSGSRSVVDAQDLSKGSVRGLDDALQRVPGVKIFDETGTGALPQISVRGLYESRSGRIQALSDGVPLALAPYGQTGMSLFPMTLATIDRIDIVRGGAAVQYGPNNVGGVINFISRPIPREWETTLQERTTFAPGGRQLWDSYLGTGGYLTDNFGLQLDLNTVNGEYGREHSDTDIQNYRLRGQWLIDDDRELTFGVQRYVADMDLAGALSVRDYKDDPRQSTRPLDRFEGDTDRVWGTYTQYFGAVGPFDSVEFSWTNFAHNSYRNFVVGLPFTPDAQPVTKQDGPRDFKVWGSEPRLSMSIDGDSIGQTWLLGARYVKEDIDYRVDRQNLNSGVTSVFRDWSFDNDAKAFYLSNAISLLDHRLTITPGVRYENATMDYSDSVTGFQRTNKAKEWLPGLTVGFQATEEWFVYANAQRSLRPPQVTQIVKEGAVDAEIAWNYETGVRYTPWNGLRVDFGLYRIDFDDQIEYNASTDRFVNLGSTRHQGIETEIFWSPEAIRGLELHAGYAYLDAEQRSGQYADNEVPYASRHQVILDGRYRFAEFWTYSLDGLYVSKSFTDAANSHAENATASVGELPSYWLWNTAIEREFKFANKSLLTASAGISNLFDRQYYYRGIDTSPWGRQPAPGRTFTVGLNYRF
ncbi:TonB-dependent siderophore receptor [Pseudomonas paraeruginosa]|uniref:TonB-dependent receptor family protein n=1 Tax=Pseudomonas aeruginosa group TaxID=136841 RepID=UPI00053E6AE1|nr:MULTISPECIES: TonB-dependent siderophore receptor [Pseudomonas aeruginosa group]KAB0745497.1 TonB-dependent siderophore receptor [Pseudomonas aeruginosa]KSP83065.1 TonB-dependent siderophore receptor [Pseudomonas aeruginosa]MBG4068009.1 TonB-dependent siderophore receptor [Pseudomonas aeruginosa]MBG5602695.1 TonB-dependent siderophore receptor [Pseudomonas aeruginosa]MBG5755954.1 TonB-dependent siderophore receptor [Pseudomonas aeruginosa]